MRPPRKRTKLFEARCDSLALAAAGLAVEPVIQAAGVVALLVTASVIKITPALQRGRAVLPGVVKVQRAVTSVPVARVRVARGVAELVSLLGGALGHLAADHHLGRRRDVSTAAAAKAVIQDVAQHAVELRRAQAVIIRSV